MSVFQPNCYKCLTKGRLCDSCKLVYIEKLKKTFEKRNKEFSSKLVSWNLQENKDTYYDNVKYNYPEIDNDDVTIPVLAELMYCQVKWRFLWKIASNINTHSFDDNYVSKLTKSELNDEEGLQSYATLYKAIKKMKERKDVGDINVWMSQKFADQVGEYIIANNYDIEYLEMGYFHILGVKCIVENRLGTTNLLLNPHAKYSHTSNWKLNLGKYQTLIFSNVKNIIGLHDHTWSGNVHTIIYRWNLENFTLVEKYQHAIIGIEDKFIVKEIAEKILWWTKMIGISLILLSVASLILESIKN